MSALVAAESCGLGTCCIGYARTAAPEAISRLLKLPQGVFVVCGLAIGVPRETPDLKPKQPESLMIHSNQYANDESLLPELKRYDDVITAYNATRSGTKSDNDWAGHILDYYKEAMSYHTLDALRRRGFVHVAKDWSKDVSIPGSSCVRISISDHYDGMRWLF